MDQTFICNSCSKAIPTRLQHPHIPACYVNDCLKNGVEAFCTCPVCKGTKTHGNEKIEDENESSFLNSKKRKSPEKPDAASLQMIVSETPQLEGKHCIECNTYRSASGVSLPFLFLGKFRTIMICKKQHITIAQDFRKIEKLIDAELELIRKHGDTSASVLMEGSQEQIEVIIFIIN
jgi:hypothetical protein